MAHKWTKCLRHPCCLGDPHRFRARGKIRSGPIIGTLATSPLPSRGSPPLQSRGKIRSGPLIGKVPTSPLPSQESPTSERGQNQKWPLIGKVPTSPLPSQESPPHESGGGDQKWPTCGQSGYITPAVSGIPNASERGKKTEVAQLWAKCLRHPCCLGNPHRLRARGKIKIGPLAGKVATSPLPSWESPPLESGGKKIKSGPLAGKVATSPLPSQGSPTLQSGGKNQKWPTCGQSDYVSPAVSRIPTASERGGKSEVAHLWAKWLRHPCRLGDPHHCRAGGRGGNQKCPTKGQSGYVIPAPSGIPTALEQGGKSEVAHLWAKWLRQPCRLEDPHCPKEGACGPTHGHMWGHPPTWDTWTGWPRQCLSKHMRERLKRHLT